MLIGFMPANSQRVLNHFLNPRSVWNSCRFLFESSFFLRPCVHNASSTNLFTPSDFNFTGTLTKPLVYPFFVFHMFLITQLLTSTSSPDCILYSFHLSSSYRLQQK